MVARQAVHLDVRRGTPAIKQLPPNFWPFGIPGQPIGNDFPCRLGVDMDVVRIGTLKRGFHCAQPKAQDIGQVVAGTEDGAATVFAKYPCLVRDATVLLQEVQALRDFEPGGGNRAHCHIG